MEDHRYWYVQMTLKCKLKIKINCKKTADVTEVNCLGEFMLKLQSILVLQQIEECMCHFEKLKSKEWISKHDNSSLINQ